MRSALGREVERGKRERTRTEKQSTAWNSKSKQMLRISSARATACEMETSAISAK